MVKTFNISLSSKGMTDIVDITNKTKKAVKDSKKENGIVTIFVPGATAAITTIEYEPGAVQDLQEAFEKLYPYRKDYAHHATWGDNNGAAHLRAAMLGPSLTIPFVKGELTLGRWQQVVFVDFDTQAREREIVVQVVGE